jgi:hypothetical protein
MKVQDRSLLFRSAFVVQWRNLIADEVSVLFDGLVSGLNTDSSAGMDRSGSLNVRVGVDGGRVGTDTSSRDRSSGKREARITERSTSNAERKAGVAERSTGQTESQSITAEKTVG